MNKVTTYCNIYYAPTEEAKAYYATRNDLNITFVNSGNTLESDTWAKLHCKPDTSGLDTSIWNEWTTLKVLRESDIKTEYVGFCHYRLFPKQLPKLKKDIFVAEGIPMLFIIDNNLILTDLEYGYKCCHTASDWDLLESIIPEADKQLFNMWKSQTVLNAPCQMFIMRKDLFNEYFDFAFPILQKLLANICLAGRDNYLKRAIPFLGERLLSFWTYMRQHKYGNSVKEFKTVKFEQFKPSTATDERGMF